MIRRMNEVRVRVPASTANLGPGFDCLGIALRLYNTTTVRRGRGPAKGEMAEEAAALFFREAGIRPFAFHWEVEGSVPRSRGLGSSVTVRLGVLHGLNGLAGQPLGRPDLFRLCSRLEGHPDNAAAAAFGGFTIAPPAGRLQRYKIAGSLRFVLLIQHRPRGMSCRRRSRCGMRSSAPDARRRSRQRLPPAATGIWPGVLTTASTSPTASRSSLFFRPSSRLPAKRGRSEAG